MKYCKCGRVSFVLVVLAICLHVVWQSSVTGDLVVPPLLICRVIPFVVAGVEMLHITRWFHKNKIATFDYICKDNCSLWLSSSKRQRLWELFFIQDANLGETCTHACKSSVILKLMLYLKYLWKNQFCSFLKCKYLTQLGFLRAEFSKQKYASAFGFRC